MGDDIYSQLLEVNETAGLGFREEFECRCVELEGGEMDVEKEVDCTGE